MRLRSLVIIASLLACPAVATAQGYASGDEHSIIRPAGYGWRNHVSVPDGPCGCAMPVRTDCYDVCRPCGLRPLCFLKRVARTLDCLLPCNLCCHGGGHHGGGYGGGGMHGCVLGNRWGGGCAGGCCTNPAGSCFDDVCCSRGPSCGCTSCSSPSCSSPSCSNTVPALSDPFQDDPPLPIPSPARDVRRAPTPSRSVMAPSRPAMMPPQRTSTPQAASPRSATQRVAAARATMPAPRAAMSAQRATMSMAQPQRAATQVAARPTSPYKITTAAGHQASASANSSSRAMQPSVLRQTSHDREPAEPAPHWIDQAHARPLIRSQSPPETPADLEIPYNPLRAP